MTSDERAFPLRQVTGSTIPPLPIGSKCSAKMMWEKSISKRKTWFPCCSTRRLVDALKLLRVGLIFAFSSIPNL